MSKKSTAVDIQSFMVELQTLLEKYEARLDFSCSECSDLHGVSNPAMAVTFNKNSTVEYPLCSGYSVDAYDLKPENQEYDYN